MSSLPHSDSSNVARKYQLYRPTLPLNPFSPRNYNFPLARCRAPNWITPGRIISRARSLCAQFFFPARALYYLARDRERERECLRREIEGCARQTRRGAEACSRRTMIGGGLEKTASVAVLILIWNDRGAGFGVLCLYCIFGRRVDWFWR